MAVFLIELTQINLTRRVFNIAPHSRITVTITVIGV